ncbi:hypothetical protein KI387_011618, partial [Taxus chinensis]
RRNGRACALSQILRTVSNRSGTRTRTLAQALTRTRTGRGTYLLRRKPPAINVFSYGQPSDDDDEEQEQEQEQGEAPGLLGGFHRLLPLGFNSASRAASLLLLLPVDPMAGVPVAGHVRGTFRRKTPPGHKEGPRQGQRSPPDARRAHLHCPEAMAGGLHAELRAQTIAPLRGRFEPLDQHCFSR